MNWLRSVVSGSTTSTNDDQKHAHVVQFSDNPSDNRKLSDLWNSYRAYSDDVGTDNVTSIALFHDFCHFLIERQRLHRGVNESTYSVSELNQQIDVTFDGHPPAVSMQLAKYLLSSSKVLSTAFSDPDIAPKLEHLNIIIRLSVIMARFPLDRITLLNGKTFESISNILQVFLEELTDRVCSPIVHGKQHVDASLTGTSLNSYSLVHSGLFPDLLCNCMTVLEIFVDPTFVWKRFMVSWDVNIERTISFDAMPSFNTLITTMQLLLDLLSLLQRSLSSRTACLPTREYDIVARTLNTLASFVYKREVLQNKLRDFSGIELLFGFIGWHTSFSISDDTKKQADKPLDQNNVRYSHDLKIACGLRAEFHIQLLTWHVLRAVTSRNATNTQCIRDIGGYKKLVDLFLWVAVHCDTLSLESLGPEISENVDNDEKQGGLISAYSRIDSAEIIVYPLSRPFRSDTQDTLSASSLCSGDFLKRDWASTVNLLLVEPCNDSNGPEVSSTCSPVMPHLPLITSNNLNVADAPVLLTGSRMFGYELDLLFQMLFSFFVSYTETDSSLIGGVSNNSVVSDNASLVLLIVPWLFNVDVRRSEENSAARALLCTKHSYVLQFFSIEIISRILCSHKSMVDDVVLHQWINVLFSSFFLEGRGLLRRNVINDMTPDRALVCQHLQLSVLDFLTFFIHNHFCEAKDLLHKFLIMLPMYEGDPECILLISGCLLNALWNRRADAQRFLQEFDILSSILECIRVLDAADAIENLTPSYVWTSSKDTSDNDVINHVLHIPAYRTSIPSWALFPRCALSAHAARGNSRVVLLRVLDEFCFGEADTQHYLRQHEPTMSLLLQYLTPTLELSPIWKWSLRIFVRVMQSITATSIDEYVVDVLQQFLQLFPSSGFYKFPRNISNSKCTKTDGDICLSEVSDVDTELQLLCSIRRMLVTNSLNENGGRTSQCPLQMSFVSAGAFKKIVNSLTLPMAADVRLKFCRSVLHTLIALMAGSNEAKALFRSEVGYDQLTEVMLVAVNGVFTQEILALFFDILVDGVFDLVTRFEIHNIDVMLCLLRMLYRLPSDALRLWCLSQIAGILRASLINKTRACKAGVISLLLTLLPENIADVQEKLFLIIELLGTHSLTAVELKAMVGQLRVKVEQGVTYQPDYSVRMQKCMQATTHRTGPLYFFDFSGNKSGLVLPLTKWPSSPSGISFSVWVRLEAMPEVSSNPAVNLSRDPYLYSFLNTKTNDALEAYIKSNSLVVSTIYRGTRFSVSFSDVELEDSRWYHIGITYSRPRALSSSSNISVYVDGVRRGRSVGRFPQLSLGFDMCRVACVGSRISEDISGLINATDMKSNSLSSNITLRPLSDESRHGLWRRRSTSSLEKLPSYTRSMLSGDMKDMAATRSLSGQMGNIYFFIDELTDAQMEGIYMLGPNYMLQFQAPSSMLSTTTTVKESAFLDGSLTSKIFLNYNSKACEDNICLDLSQQHGTAHIMAATLCGNQCVCHDVRQSIHCIGGVSLLFLLVPQMGLPSRDTSGILNYDCDSSRVSQFFWLLSDIISGDIVNMDMLHHTRGLATVEVLLQPLAPYFITVDALNAIQRLVTVTERHQVQRDVFDHLLFSFRLWALTTYETQLLHINYLFTLIKSNAEQFRALHGVSFFLDILLTYAWYDPNPEQSFGIDDVIHTTGEVVGRHLKGTELCNVRFALLSIIRFYTCGGMTPEEFNQLLNFCTVAVESDPMQVADIISLLIQLISLYPASCVVRHFNDTVDADQILFSILRCSSEAVRCSTLSLIGLLISSSPKSSRLCQIFRLENGYCESVFGALSLFPLSDDVATALIHLSLGKTPEHYPSSCGGLGHINSDFYNSNNSNECSLQVPAYIIVLLRVLALSSPEFRSRAVYNLFVTVFKADGIQENGNFLVAHDPLWAFYILDLVPTVHNADSLSHINDDHICVLVESVVNILYIVLWQQFAFSQLGCNLLDITLHYIDISVGQTTVAHDITRDLFLKLIEFAKEGIELPIKDSPSFNRYHNLLQLLLAIEEFVFPPSDRESQNVTSFYDKAIIRRNNDNVWIDAPLANEVVELMNTLDILSTSLSNNQLDALQRRRFSHGSVSSAIRRRSTTNSFDSSIVYERRPRSMRSFSIRLLLLLVQYNDYVIVDRAMGYLIGIHGDSENESLDISLLIIGTLYDFMQSTKTKSEIHKKTIFSIMINLLRRHQHTLSVGRPVTGNPRVVKDHLLIPPHILSKDVTNDIFFSFFNTKEWKHFITSSCLPVIADVDTLNHELGHLFVERQGYMLRTLSGPPPEAHESKLRLERACLESTLTRCNKEKKRREKHATLLENDRLALMRQWRATVQFFTSERGALASRPASRVFWKLDRIEEFNRMRRKLIRNFNHNDHREASRLRDEGFPSPSDAPVAADSMNNSTDVFSHISKEARVKDIKEDCLGDDEWGVIKEAGAKSSADSVASEEKPVHSTYCELVRFMAIVKGKLDIFPTYLYFNAHSREDVDKNKELDELVDLAVRDFMWPLDQIREVHLRRHLLRRSALELFLVDQTNYFLNFRQHDRNKVYSKLLSLRPPLLVHSTSRSPLEMLRKSGLTQKWQKRRISNFDYLMQLNTIAGRTYNDLNQYPIFPWVLADYESETLDLNDPKVYRDLSRPIGALTESRRKLFEERYQSFEDPSGVVDKFHYGTHYSTAGTVLHYLLRLEPFTSLHVQLQSGKFDHSDRQFISIPETWESCLTSTSDVKELIPEFFYLPEFLRNINSYDLGNRQHTNMPIDDVVLPRWASSAEDFVAKHRAALESEYVSTHLHEWIDLIFGYKQRGPAAVEALNVFFYVTYEGAIDLDAITDENEREAIESQINNFGQTPTQLLKKPHPSRQSCVNSVLNTACDDHEVLVTNIDTSTSAPPSLCIPTRRGSLVPVSSRSVFLHVQELKAYFIQISPASDPLVLVEPAESQLHSFLHNGLPDRVVSVSRHGKLGLHSWLPVPAHPNGALPFTFELDSSTKSKILGGGPFSQDINVNCHLFSITHDGKIIFSGGRWDNSVKVTHVDTGRVLQTLIHHTDVVTCLSLDPSGKTLVSGSKDTTAVVWEVVSSSGGHHHYINPNPLLTLYGHDSDISCIEVNLELDLVITGSLDGTLIFHSVRQGRYIQTVVPPAGRCHASSDLGPYDRVHGIMIHNIAIAPRIGAVIVHTRYNDPASHLEDLALHCYTFNGRHLKSEFIDDHIVDIIVSSNSDFFVAVSLEGTVQIRRTSPSIQLMHTLNVHIPIACVTLSAEEEHIMMGLKDGKLILLALPPHR